MMFDMPPPLQSRGIAAYKKTWDLFFAYHQPGQAFDVEELQMVRRRHRRLCGRHHALRVGHSQWPSRAGWLPVSTDHRPLQGRRCLVHPARAPFGSGDGLEELD